MDLFLSQFHLLRPLWLLALIPAALLFVLLLKRRLASARWKGIIDESLMPHVLDQMPSEQSRWPLWFILFTWIITTIALAGPAWEQLPQPIQKKEDALVIVMDMSLSMAAQDVSPNRATRARQKVIDILKQRNEGLTALVVYAGDAYTVTPLTDDADTIINLVPSLSPFIMPAMGSRPDKALALADKLIIDAGLTRAEFLLITDGIQHKDISRIKKVLGSKQQQLSVITLGTEEGAPIAMQDGGFKRDSQGNIVLPKLDLDIIKQLASELKIDWHQMSFDDSDWHYLLNMNTLNGDSENESYDSQSTTNDKNTLERQFDLWSDQGYWLIFIVIVIAAISFRRGWLLSIAFLFTLHPETSYASLWDDAWQTKDQQAQQVFKTNPAMAAEMFKDPNWKASSLYRAQEFEQAAELLSSEIEANKDALPTQNSERYFNRGNALAHAGQLEKAIESYEKALELNEEFSDAEFNKSLVEELLQQQKQQQSDEKKDSDEQQDSDQQSDEQQDSDEQKKSDQQQDSDQDSNQQESDEQESENNDPEEQDPQQKESEEEKSDEDSKNEQSAESDKNEQQTEEEKQAEQERQAKQAEDNMSREEKQALEQWLNRIPDDPGGLLKRKFLYQYKQRDHQDEGEVSW